MQIIINKIIRINYMDVINKNIVRIITIYSQF